MKALKNSVCIAFEWCESSKRLCHPCSSPSEIQCHRLHNTNDTALVHTSVCCTVCLIKETFHLDSSCYLQHHARIHLARL